MTSIQDSILGAVDTLVNNRVSSIQADKTVIATITACSNALTNEYKVSYNGGYMTAYAQDGNSYSQNSSVYVLVPLGDFTQKKTIIGTTQAVSDDENISFVTSALSNYNMIGSNTIINNSKATPRGLNSYLKNDYALLYKHGKQSTDELPFLSISEEELENNLKEAEAVLVEASFMTRLPRAHKNATSGRYGIQFVLAFQDASQEPVAILDEENLKEKALSEEESQAVSTIANNHAELLSQFTNNAFVDQDIAKYKTQLAEYEALLKTAQAQLDKMEVSDDTRKALEAYQNVITELKEELESANNLNAIGYDCENVFYKYNYTPDKKEYTEAELEECTAQNITYKSYTIDSRQMVGDPYRFSSYYDQNLIFPIDAENFLYIDSILFYSQDFVEKDDAINADSWGNDIFIDQVEFYGLKTITATNGDYTLSLSMPKGSTYKSISSEDSLQIVGSLKQKSTINLSDVTVFYWLKQNNKITSDKAFAYAGAGWELLENLGHNYYCDIPASNNKAYENKYLCIAIYNSELILKEEFTLYNNSCKRDLSITSSLGTKFAFDRGEPVLTCLIDGKESNFETDKYPDDYFTFVWSVTDSSGNVLTLNQTIEELEAQLNSEGGYSSYSEYITIKNKIAQMSGVVVEGNKLTYPTKQINAQATIKCSVYMRESEPDEGQTVDDIEYCIGTPEITLLNESVASVSDYYIEITNGNQIFQYSESGVSPASTSLTEPQTILPLSCKFYDPNNLEVASSSYEVKWKFPLENSLIVAPTVNVQANPANDNLEWCMSQNYPLSIASEYNYSAINNQVQCIVTYEGQTYTKDSSLTFTKVGENGTNGTDFAAKVSVVTPSGWDESVLPALVFDETSDVPVSWNTSKTFGQKDFKFELFQKSEEMTVSSVNWSMASGRTSNYSITNNSEDATKGDLSYSDNLSMYRNLVVKGSTTLEGTRYNAFCGFPTIIYTSKKVSTGQTDEYGNIIYQNQKKADYQVQILRDTTLKSILYNSNGYNPLYNINQGVGIRILDGQVSRTDKFIVWQAEGGAPTKINNEYSQNPTNAAFRLSFSVGATTGESKIQSGQTSVEDEEGNVTIIPGKTQVYIVPDDFYSGEYTNNLVHGKIYSQEPTKDSNGNYDATDAASKLEAEFYVPIFMSLNTNELKSLNSWDGTHVEVNEDDNYILAPQIGAGSKDKDNKFTGIVMGTAKFYDQTNSSKTNTLESSEEIGLLGYAAGKRSILLDAATGKAVFGLAETNSSQTNSYQEGRIELVPGGISSIGSWKIGSRSIYNSTVINNRGDGTLDGKYSDLSDDYDISIPHNTNGILLSAEPAYISIKAKPLEADDTENVDFDSASTIIQPYDSFELQLDPNDSSVFTVYRHTAAPEDIVCNVVCRYLDDNGTPCFKIYDSNNLTNITNCYIYKSEDLTYKDDKLEPVFNATQLAEARFDDDNNPTKIIGWTVLSKLENKTSSPYVIARRLYDKSTKTFTGDWYFCCVNGPQGTTYTLPEAQDDYIENIKIAEEEFSQNYSYHREAKVGINNQGRFYTNALKDNTTALNIGPLGAFGHRATENAYTGASFEVGTGSNSNTLIKMFTDTSDINKKTGRLYISGATDNKTEYQRPLSFHGNSISLYSNNGKSVDTDPTTKFVLENSYLEFGNFATDSDGNNTGSYFHMPYEHSSKDDSTKLNLTTNLKFNMPMNRAAIITLGETALNASSIESNVTGTSKYTVGDTLTLKAQAGKSDTSGNKTYPSGNSELNIRQVNTTISSTGLNVRSETTAELLDIEGKKYARGSMFEFQLSDDTANYSYLKSQAKIEIVHNPTENLYAEGGLLKGATSGITLVSNNSAEGIKMYAIPVNKTGTSEGVSFTMTPSSDGKSFWRLESPLGGVFASMTDKGYRYVGITPGLITEWGDFQDVMPRSTTSIQAARDIVSTGGNIISANGDVKSINGWMYANNYYVTSESGISWSDGYFWNEADFRYAYNNSADWDSRRSGIYGSISTAQTTANGAQGRADDAYSYAEKCWSYANEKLSVQDFNTFKDNLRNVCRRSYLSADDLAVAIRNILQ